MPNLREKTWTSTTPANVEDAQFWEDHLISNEDASKLENITGVPDGGSSGQVLTRTTSGVGWRDPASSGHTVQNAAGVDMPYQGTLQFLGADVANDSVNGKTVVDCHGEKGDAATIAAGTVTMLPAGSTPTVTNSGTSSAAVFDFGIPSSGGGLYPYLYIDSEAGATVTVDAPDGSTIIPTPAGSGHWECELPAYGVYVIHSVLAGQGDATYSLTVDDVKEYHVTDSHYDFTINVIADAGSTIRVSAGTEVYTGTGTGSAVAFVVHQPSTVYTIEETLDGHTDTETVTSASTSGGSVTVTVHVFEAILNISTTSASLFGKSISIMKDGVSVGSTAFNNSGSVTYAVHETGIYTLTCDGYDASVTVTTETTYPVSILAGLDLATWISAGSTTEHPLNPSSYADFAALEADEKAIRQLMTVHDAVDYLAQATAGDSLMEEVINSDVCAKWINLRDYALDTLYANSDIASEMDTADKYFYGEWVENNGTWGAKGNVPIMTANNAPYGVASAYQVFDGNSGTSASGTDFSYQSVNPICVKKFECSVNGGTLQGSNDGSTYTDISDPSSNTTYYMYHKVHFASSQTVNTLQFYGRELKPLVPVMTDNTHPSGEAISDEPTNSNGEAYKAFDNNSSTRWFGSAKVNTAYIGYLFDKEQKVQFIAGKMGSSTSNSCTKTFKFQYNNDSSWSDIPNGSCTVTTSSDTSVIFTPVICNVSTTGIRALLTSTSVPSRMQSHELQFYGFDYSEKEFAPNSNRLEIYDHGVEVVEMDAPIIAAGATAEKQSYQLYGYEPASGTPSYAFTTSQAVNFPSGKYSRLVGKVGNTAYGVNASQSMFWYGLKVGKTWSYGDQTMAVSLGVTPTTLASGSIENGVDISSVTGDYFVMFSSISNTQLRYASCEELWLE